MGEFGFISDKLEIKFLILYIAARLIQPVRFEMLQEASMCDGGVDYFGFSECLADLVRTEHLTVDGDGQYAITEKGRRNSAVCESSLPYSVRMRADEELAALNEQAQAAQPGERLHGAEGPGLRGAAVPQRRAGAAHGTGTSGDPGGHGQGAAKKFQGPRRGDLHQDHGPPLRRELRA